MKSHSEEEDEGGGQTLHCECPFGINAYHKTNGGSIYPLAVSPLTAPSLTPSLRLFLHSPTRSPFQFGTIL